MPAPSPRLLVIIPSWNEEVTLPQVIEETRATVPWADILVVNDGSTDRTSEVARAAKAEVLDLPLNLGVGGAMRAGYKYARHHRYSYAVQLDADGQHDPRDIPRLLEACESGPYDVVIGARFAGRGTYVVRGPRRWSMRMLSVVLSRVTGARLTDTTSGFKLSNTRAIRVFASNYPAEYLGDTVEALVIAARAGLRVDQVGVEMRPRAGGTPSHSPLKAAIFLGRALLALVVAISRPSENLMEVTP
ncbi:glycosyltransferase family 2 protein [Cellulosimicrobium sp. 72-3]|uniref:glycosyltransferase family 2 protein n=1 Tax=Cellulosimicrobium sp. 72-3 TaxID=2731680 RepID=UPI00148EB021|nr:glycosyltransferase family 2 protein [Cellulosimicrobium sp. 72-3]